MTAAINSAASGGAETLLKSVSGKGSSGNRGQLKEKDENDPKPESATQSAPREDVDAASTHVDKTRKTVQRKQDKGKSDEDNSSFEDTFASIDQDQTKDASSKTAVGTSASLNLLAPQVTTDRVLGTTADSVSTQTDTSQAPVRAAALMQQKSILALMDAKNKIFANSADLKAEDATDNVAADHNAIPQDTTELVPVAINRRETHWNFNSDGMTSVASQLSALNTGKSAPSAAVLAQNLGSVATAKGQQSDVKLSMDSLQPVAAPTAAKANNDQNANASFNNDGGSKNDSRPHMEIASEIAKKADKPDATPSLDQIFTTGKSASANAATVGNQVRDGVIASLGSNATGASAATSVVDVPTRSTAAPVLRTLDLTLSPPDLGSVRIRLSLSSNSLSIEAEASKASTAKLLTDDRPNLERGLKDAGYDISSIKITDASASASANANGWQTNGSPSRDGDPSRSGFMSRQDGGDMQRRDGSPSDQTNRRSRESHPQPAPAEVASSRSGNAVYI
ncbi:MAG: flagellar hook-length control protein FliK [Proteobacteria bacterium]|nr:flagellar hook-length control protein FliK [Pseudomonadota bacterium]